MSHALIIPSAEPGYYDQERWSAFRPMKVRNALEDEGLPVPIGSERYGLLSSVVVHLGPEVAPQIHQPQSRPTLGSCYRVESYLAALNELAGATGVASRRLLWLLPQARKAQLKTATVALLRMASHTLLDATLRNLQTMTEST